MESEYLERILEYTLMNERGTIYRTLSSKVHKIEKYIWKNLLFFFVILYVFLKYKMFFSGKDLFVVILHKTTVFSIFLKIFLRNFGQKI